VDINPILNSVLDLSAAHNLSESPVQAMSMLGTQFNAFASSS